MVTNSKRLSLGQMDVLSFLFFVKLVLHLHFCCSDVVFPTALSLKDVPHVYLLRLALIQALQCSFD